ncbi:MAG: hypothetical protein FWE76_04095 [Symbiobacteriaceae bacterium]|nr:hypothetical protein [Symbiobacteriaceae bacterium]
MKSIVKYSGIARQSLLNAIQYPANIISRLLMYSLFISVFFCLWGAIYQGGEVHGYSLVQMIWYLCFTELIVFCCRTTVYTQMNDDVKSGAIAYLLVRPCHYIIFQFFQSLGELCVNLVAFGSYAIVLALTYVGVLEGFSFYNMPYILISFILGITLNFFMLISLGLTAFIWEENTGFYFVYQKLIFMLGMFIPLEFLPVWLQSIARMLPFSYVAWAPARLAVAYSSEFRDQVLPLQFLWVFASVWLAVFCYSRAVLHIQGQGG